MSDPQPWDFPDARGNVIRIVPRRDLNKCVGGVNACLVPTVSDFIEISSDFFFHGSILLSMQ